MRIFRLLVVLVAVAILGLATASTAAAQHRVSHPRKAPPAWFTAGFKARVDAAGHRGVPLAGPGVLDVCPGVVLHEGGVGTGSCLVYPYGCTANFVYSDSGSAPAVADGHLYLGSAGHCSDKPGQAVYAAISTPGLGPSIARIGTVKVEELRKAGVTKEMAMAWQHFYENEKARNPKNPSAGGRAQLMAAIAGKL